MIINNLVLTKRNSY